MGVVISLDMVVQNLAGNRLERMQKEEENKEVVERNAKEDKYRK